MKPRKTIRHTIGITYTDPDGCRREATIVTFEKYYMSLKQVEGHVAIYYPGSTPIWFDTIPEYYTE